MLDVVFLSRPFIVQTGLLLISEEPVGTEGPYRKVLVLLNHPVKQTQSAPVLLRSN
jgi:hypothetical protein